MAKHRVKFTVVKICVCYKSILLRQKWVQFFIIYSWIMGNGQSLLGHQISTTEVCDWWGIFSGTLSGGKHCLCFDHQHLQGHYPHGSAIPSHMYTEHTYWREKIYLLYCKESTLVPQCRQWHVLLFVCNIRHLCAFKCSPYCMVSGKLRVPSIHFILFAIFGCWNL